MLKLSILHFFKRTFCILVLAAYISPLSAAPDYPDTLCTTTVLIGDSTYSIILNKPDNTGMSGLSVIQTAPGAHKKPHSSLYFFIILPDGNYTSLGHSNTGFVQYKPIRLQAKTSQPNLNVGQMQAWAMRKNDPKPPDPPSGKMPPKYYDLVTPPDITTNGVSFQSSSTITVGPQLIADQYLSSDQAISIGSSWSIWNADNAYYYLIVSYTNKTKQNEPISGILKIKNCHDSTGFRFVDYSRYAYGQGLQSFTSNTNFLAGDSLNIEFFGLEPKEVRHIYIRMARRSPATGFSAKFRAILEVPPIIRDPSKFYDTGCTEFILKTAPHDPNSKQVNTRKCTTSGSGTLVYTINFQNLGNGYARDVIINDVLPAELAPYNVVPLASSDAFSFTRTGNAIQFVFNNINLPGSAQTIPRSFNYHETEGWVRFSCPATCPVIGTSIKNYAGITFIGTDGTQQPVINTDTIATVSDTTKYKDWAIVEPVPCEPKASCCFRWSKRCKWCFYRRCNPKIKSKSAN